MLNKNVKQLYVGVVNNRVIFAATNLSNFAALCNEFYPEVNRSLTYYRTNFLKKDQIKTPLDSGDVLFLQKVK